MGRGPLLRTSLALLAFATGMVTGVVTPARASVRKHRPVPVKVTGAAPSAPAAPTQGQLAVAKYIQLGKPIFCGGGNGPYVAFTFDDGPGPLTSQLLQLLAAEHVPATFFLVGRNVAANPALTRTMMNVGAIGDHTWDHPVLLTLPPSAIDQEIRSTRDLINATIGHSIMLFRAPFGQHNPVVDSIALGLGLLPV